MLEEFTDHEQYLIEQALKQQRFTSDEYYNLYEKVSGRHE